MWKQWYFLGYLSQVPEFIFEWLFDWNIHGNRHCSRSGRESIIKTIPLESGKRFGKAAPRLGQKLSFDTSNNLIGTNSEDFGELCGIAAGVMVSVDRHSMKAKLLFQPNFPRAKLSA